MAFPALEYLPEDEDTWRESDKDANDARDCFWGKGHNCLLILLLFWMIRDVCE